MISAKEARAASQLSSQKRIQLVQEQTIPAILKQIEKCIEREIDCGKYECKYFTDVMYEDVCILSTDYNSVC